MEHRISLLSVLAIAFLSVAALTNCSESTSFQRISLDDALVELGDPGGTITDTDNDGVPDAIVGDDGTVIPITPPGEAPAPDTTPIPGADPTPPPVRDTSGNCIFTSSTAARGFSGNSASITYTAADLAGQSNFLLNLSGNGNTVTIDLTGTTIQRLIFKHAGGSNRVNVVNTAMGVGLCNEMSGGDNKEFLDATNSAALVDLESGAGNNNKLDVRFVPSYGLRYSLSGSNNCVSAPAGTTVLSGSTGDGAHIGDGTTCL